MCVALVIIDAAASCAASLKSESFEAVRVGMSPATNALKEGAAGDPVVGPAQT